MSFNTFDIFKRIERKPDVRSYTPKSLFPEHFIGLLVGKPGMGKSTMLETLLHIPEGFREKFDIILLISPTRIGSIAYNSEYWSPDFSVDWIIERIKHFRDIIKDEEKEKKEMKQGKRKKYKISDESYREKYGDEQDEESGSNDYSLAESSGLEGVNDNNKTKYSALVIIDDKISDIGANFNNPALKSLFWNRRGVVPDVCTSLLLTTQSFKALPLKLRNSLSFIIVFNVTPIEMEAVFKEHLFGGKKGLLPTIQAHYKQNKHNFVYILCDEGKVFLNFQRVIS
jgi:A32 protein